MAAVQRKLVHKQFNSPIGLYSDQNVKETLDRELRAFSNGNVGIELNEAPRTLNLANSSVLKMVEEEDYERAHPGYKRVAWPPVDSAPVYATVPQAQNPPPSTYEPTQNHYQPQATQAFQPVSHQPSAQNYQAQNYAQPQSQQHHTQAPPQTSPYGRGQSPGVIQLRRETPVSQKPAPVYTSQPVTASLGGGSKMRGDLKWPPPEYKSQAEAENEERRRIAMGPVCRPRRVQKDYTGFFAKNALNHYYPGYKVPPGTQHMYTQY